MGSILETHALTVANVPQKGDLRGLDGVSLSSKEVLVANAIIESAMLEVQAKLDEMISQIEVSIVPLKPASVLEAAHEVLAPEKKASDDDRFLLTFDMETLLDISDINQVQVWIESTSSKALRLNVADDFKIIAEELINSTKRLSAESPVSIVLNDVKNFAEKTIKFGIFLSPKLNDIEKGISRGLLLPDDAKCAEVKRFCKTVAAEITILKRMGSPDNLISSLLREKHLKDVVGHIEPMPKGLSPEMIKASGEAIGISSKVLAKMSLDQVTDFNQLESVMTLFKDEFNEETLDPVAKAFGLEMVYYAKPYKSVKFAPTIEVYETRSAKDSLIRKLKKENIELDLAGQIVKFNDLMPEAQNIVAKALLFTSKEELAELKATAREDNLAFKEAARVGESHPRFKEAKEFYGPGLKPIKPKVYDRPETPKSPTVRNEGWKIMPASTTVVETVATAKKPSRHLETGIIVLERVFNPANFPALIEGIKGTI